MNSPSLRFRPRRLESDETRRVARALARAASGSLDRAHDQTHDPAHDPAHDPEASDAVHEARKRFKELRALLRLTAGTAHAAELAAAQRALRDAGRCLAPARDATSRIEAIAGLEKRDPASIPLLAPLRAVLAGLPAPRADIEGARALLAGASEGIEACTFSQCDPASLARGLRRSFDRACRAMGAALEAGTPPLFHEWRKRTKDHWYQTRAAAGHEPELAGRERGLRRLSQLLGDHHDLVVLSGVAVRHLDGMTAIRLLSMIEERMDGLEWDAESLGLILFPRGGFAATTGRGGERLSTSVTAAGTREHGRGSAPPVAGDFWGGLAAMMVAMPSAVAFGVAIFTAASPELAARGALAGVVGAAVLGIVAPLVSRNGGFITAPCAPAAAVMAGMAAQLVQGGGVSTARLLVLLGLVALASAGLQIAYGALRLGLIIKYIPYQVVTGYLSGVAVIIATAQLPKLLGGVGSHLGETLVTPGSWKWPGIIVGVVTIAAAAMASRITRAVPATIVGLAAGVGSYFALALVRPELRSLVGNPLVVGPIQAEGLSPAAILRRLASIPTVTASDIALLVAPALTLSVLLSIDTLKTGVVLDALTRTRHDSNRELIGQGVANLASFLAGGVPGSGAAGPTLVNVTSGGRTLWSGVVEGALVVLAFLAVGPLLAWIPIAALAGILLVVAWRMFDFSMFRLLIVPSTRLDFAVIAAVVVVAETVGLIQASLVGVFLAILLFIRNQIRVSVIVRKTDLRFIRSKRRRSAEQVRILDERGALAAFVQLRGDLFFGTTDQLFSDLEPELNSCRYVLLDCRRVQSMDFTAAHLLEQMEDRLRERGGRLLFSGMPSTLLTRQDIEDYLRKLRLIGAESAGAVFETRDGALEWMEDRVLESAGFVDQPSAPPLQLEDFELLRDLEAPLFDRLRTVTLERVFSPGEQVFEVGATGDELFLVRSGHVHILLPLEGGLRHQLASIGRNDFFGEMSFLDGGVRSAQAEAATPVHVFSISRSAFDRVAGPGDKLAAGVFAGLALAIARRMRVTDSELRALEER